MTGKNESELELSEGEIVSDLEENSESGKGSETKSQARKQQIESMRLTILSNQESEFDELPELKETAENHLQVIENEIVEYQKEQKKKSQAEGGDKGQHPDPTMQPPKEQRKKKYTKKIPPRQREEGEGQRVQNSTKK